MIWHHSWPIGTGNGTAHQAMAGLFFLPSYPTWSCNSSLVDLAMISCGYEKCTHEQLKVYCIVATCLKLKLDEIVS